MPPEMEDSAPDDASTVSSAVLDAIEHLDGHTDTTTERVDEQRRIDLLAAHSRLAELDTSDAPRDVAETIHDVVDRLAETPDVAPDEWDVIAQGALADLAPIAARAARDPSPREYDPIPASFDDLPEITDPTPQQRSRAQRHYGAHRIPDDGPIPDLHPHFEVPVTIEIPEWVLDVTSIRIIERNDPDETDAIDLLKNFALATEQYRTSDGRDAVDALLKDPLE